MKQPYITPSYGVEAFTCPFCNAFSKHNWCHASNIYIGISLTFCEHCTKKMIWYEDKIIYPRVTGAPMPNDDMNDEIIKDYNEARDIVVDSPRGASALLRLALQKLCVQLGEKGKNINDDIGNLVKRGLPVKIQQALDCTRVIGNQAVHPGEIDINDEPEIAYSLFELINAIADAMITQPKEIQALYDRLPVTARNAIKKRDET